MKREQNLKLIEFISKTAGIPSDQKEKMMDYAMKNKILLWILETHEWRVRIRRKAPIK